MIWRERYLLGVRRRHSAGAAHSESSSPTADIPPMAAAIAAMGS